MLEIKYPVGSLVRGTELGDSYYNNCGTALKLAKVINVEKRVKSVMLDIEILKHTKKTLVGKRKTVNQEYMDKGSDKRGYNYDYEGNLSKNNLLINIDGKVHTKNVNAVIVGTKWFSIKDPKIALDSSTNSYNYKQAMIKAVVSSTGEVGYCTDKDSVVTDELGTVYMNKIVALDNGLEECLFDGNFYKDKRKMPKAKVAYSEKYSFSNIIDKPHLIKKNNINNIKLGVESPSYRITNGFKGTFGVELETSKGMLPLKVVESKALNIKCMRDGSITGGEYVTGILKGDMGFDNLHKTAVELAKRCEVDNRTGIHVHIGGLKFDKDFVVFAYMLALKLENEIQAFMPSTRRGDSTMPWGNNGDKVFKDYCKNLVPIDFGEFYKNKDNMTIDLWQHYINKYYNSIYGILTGGYTAPKEDSIGGLHPKMGGGGHRWISERYYWFNLIPCCFSKVRSDDENRRGTKWSGQTVEFRNHPGSLNYEKIKNWVLICMAFVKYVQDNKEQILKNYENGITMNDIVDHMFEGSPERAANLKSYIEERKLKFSKKTNKSYSADDIINEEKSLKELCV